ncbi:MAG: peptidoglycan DD-metalloendopeptidase family protein [Sulfurimonas sp.]|nr:peptidoglycan DD-metalloendopeptidase family protein [Sulfurimonas sp.]
MIRLLLTLVLVLSFLNAKDDINKKISKTNSRMSSYSKNYSNINRKMAKTAKAILKQKKELEKQNKYLKKLEKELGIKESSYKDNSTQLVQLKGYQRELKKEQNSIEEELVFVIAQSVSLSVILEEDYAVNAESLIEFEVLNNMLSASKKRAKKLNKKFYSNSKNIDILKNHTHKLEVAITNIDQKRKKLLKTKKANKKALKKLELSKSSYKKALKKLISKQNALKKTLAQLNIIKIDKAKKAKQEKERREAFKRKSIVSNENLPKVKKHGSSYQAIKTKRYRGKKTIAPLDSYTMTKKYGTYTDPIYGIKIFNESISLKPRKANAKVKTVFNGKVIYADKTAVLDNIVIIEHKNGLHTIYANLSQISPNIKKGKKIKKGYTIGRVSDELVFEVTQKSYHINPIRLFR